MMPSISFEPSSEPTGEPSMMPSVSFEPSSKPSSQPSSQPSTSHSPSSYPSMVPTTVPSLSHSPSLGPSELPSLLPSELPTSVPSVSRSPSVFVDLRSKPCTVCYDILTPDMVKYEEPCTKSGAMLMISCNKQDDWIQEKYCQLSCFLYGNGYQGDNCCLPSEYPTSIPSHAPSRAMPNTPSSVPSNISQKPSYVPSSLTSQKPSSYSLVPSISQSFDPSQVLGNNPTSVPSIEASKDPSSTLSYAPSSSNAPSSKPIIIQCIECVDIRTPAMISYDEKCNQSAFLLQIACKDNEVWRTNSYCQLSCFLAENGYDGVKCCQTS